MKKIICSIIASVIGFMIGILLIAVITYTVGTAMYVAHMPALDRVAISVEETIHGTGSAKELYNDLKIEYIIDGLRVAFSKG